MLRGEDTYLVRVGDQTADVLHLQVGNLWLALRGEQSEQTAHSGVILTGRRHHLDFHLAQIAGLEQVLQLPMLNVQSAERLAQHTLLDDCTHCRRWPASHQLVTCHPRRDALFDRLLVEERLSAGEHSLCVLLGLQQPRHCLVGEVAELDRLRLQPRIIPKPLRMPHPSPRPRPLHILRSRSQQPSTLQQLMHRDKQFGLRRPPPRSTDEMVSSPYPRRSPSSFWLIPARTRATVICRPSARNRSATSSVPSASPPVGSPEPPACAVIPHQRPLPSHQGRTAERPARSRPCARTSRPPPRDSHPPYRPVPSTQ